ncbi:MAG: YdcF family protein [Bacteroidota bacterium]|nr:YdcF family protein [Bacteroidota bacterium]
MYFLKQFQNINFFHNLKNERKYKLIKGKNLILLAIIVLSVFSCYLLTYIRYSNQNLFLQNFNFIHTGNLISVVFFSLIIIFSFINIFSGGKFSNSGMTSLLVVSASGITAIIFSMLISGNDSKLILYMIFFTLNGYLLIMLAALAFSRSKKIHYFSNFGLFLLLSLIGFLIIIYLIYNFTDDSKSYSAGNRKADAGVILGAAVWGGNRPSPVLRERINKGYEIYEKKYVTKLILTGGGSPNEMTEAEVQRNELIKYGVEPKNLMVEDKSNSTFEQIQYIRDKYYNRFNYNRIIVISDNFHLFRTMQICLFNNMKADFIATDTPLSTETAINFSIKESFAVFIFWVFGMG